MIDEAGRDLYDVPKTLLQYFPGCPPGDVEEAVEIHAEHFSHNLRPCDR